MYRSPKNPNVIIIPADPKIVQKEAECEKAVNRINAELLDIYRDLPLLNARIRELENVIHIMLDRLDVLKAEKQEKEKRRFELEQKRRSIQ